MGSDQVCYGNWQVSAEPQPRVNPFLFEQPGDLENVVNLRSLALSAMSPETNVWGIAYMQLLVSSTSYQPTTVRLVLFGDVAIDNLMENRETLSATINSPDEVDVRQFPATGTTVVTTLTPDTIVTAIGRLEDGSWLRVETDEEGIVGWVQSTLVTVDGDVESLKPETATAPYYGPMQAFLYSNGDTGSCSSAPSDGMLIQTPEGQGRVTFLINEVSIDLVSSQTGSTTFLQAQPAGNMAISVLQGEATVSVGRTDYTATAGNQILVPLTADLSPAAPPSRPQAISQSFVAGIRSLGLDMNPIPTMRDTTIQEPGPESDALEDSNTSSNTGSGESVDAPEGNNSAAPPAQNADESTNSALPTATPVPPPTAVPPTPVPPPTEAPPPTDDCPGNSCNAPGNDPTACPGNSCNAPGHN